MQKKSRLGTIINGFIALKDLKNISNLVTFSLLHQNKKQPLTIRSKVVLFGSKTAVFFIFLIKCYFAYASLCTFATALPEGSFMFLNASSHSNAILVLHATLASCGTHNAAASLGKCSANIER